jgi:hypothetical protein
VAELNSLTANLAVFRYKKLLGFYADTENERHTVYAVDSNDLFNRYGNTGRPENSIQPLSSVPGKEPDCPGATDGWEGAA